jgi:hypothetical protein
MFKTAWVFKERHCPTLLNINILLAVVVFLKLQWLSILFLFCPADHHCVFERFILYLLSTSVIASALSAICSFIKSIRSIALLFIPSYSNVLIQIFEEISMHRSDL